MYPSLDPEQTESASRLEYSSADARGPFELGHLSGLLTRRQAGRVRVERQDSTALGRRDGRAATDAQGPFEPGQLSSLLT